jgi:bifunctional ADP-heptose synthase (sugar kinase/adenylyltransferase)
MRPALWHGVSPPKVRCHHQNRFFFFCHHQKCNYLFNKYKELNRIQSNKKEFQKVHETRRKKQNMEELKIIQEAENKLEKRMKLRSAKNIS